MRLFGHNHLFCKMLKKKKRHYVMVRLWFSLNFVVFSYYIHIPYIVSLECSLFVVVHLCDIVLFSVFKCSHPVHRRTRGLYKMYIYVCTCLGILAIPTWSNNGVRSGELSTGTAAGS